MHSSTSKHKILENLPRCLHWKYFRDFWMIQSHGDIDHVHVYIVEYCQDTLIGYFLGIVIGISPVTVTVTATDAQCELHLLCLDVCWRNCSIWRVKSCIKCFILASSFTCKITFLSLLHNTRVMSINQTTVFSELKNLVIDPLSHQSSCETGFFSLWL